MMTTASILRPETQSRLDLYEAHRAAILEEFAAMPEELVPHMCVVVLSLEDQRARAIAESRFGRFRVVRQRDAMRRAGKPPAYVKACAIKRVDAMLGEYFPDRRPVLATFRKPTDTPCIVVLAGGITVLDVLQEPEPATPNLAV